MDALLADLRLAVRRLGKSPAFSASVLIILALGIGANSALFAAVDQTVIRPLPYREPDRLAIVWEDYSAFGAPKQRVSPATFLDWRRRTRAFEALAAYGTVTNNLSGAGAPEEVLGERITSNLISLLGVRPLIGRTFTVDEEGPEVRAVVLSYGLWMRQFAGDRGAVGKTIQMDGVPYTVIGVMPRGFDYPDRETEYWVPFGLTPQLLSRRNSHFLHVIGRLRPTVSLRAAQEDMTRIAGELAVEYPATNARIAARVVALRDEMVGTSFTAFVLLLGASGCVLLIGCANVANLLLARASDRRHEVAVRVSLGATPSRIISGLLVDNLLLASLGGALGLVLARVGLPVLQRFVPSALGGFVDLHLDGRVLAFAAVAAMASGVVVGLAPALQLARVDRTGPAVLGHPHGRLRNLLVVTELAVALVLVISAVLLIETLFHLQAVDPGFSARGMLTANLSIPFPKYQDPEKRRTFYDNILTHVRSIPGTVSVGLTSDLPYTSRGNTMSLTVDGQQQPPGVPPDVLFRLVSAGYLETIGATLHAGRFLSAGDRSGSQSVVVVNAALARQYWPGESPLGHRIDTGTGDGVPRWMTIVGVVNDVRERGIDRALKSAVYVPYPQTDITFFQPSEIAVRTTRPPLAIASEVEAAVHAVDPDQPVSQVRTIEEIVDAELGDRTQVLQLLAGFAAVALVLALVGTFAVLSYAVSQRRREIGLRLAIGARPTDIMRDMFGYTAKLTAVGVAVGLAAAAAATRVLSTLLFEVTSRDPETFVGVALLVTMTAFIAAYVPVRRAARVDPVTALRAE